MVDHWSIRSQLSVPAGNPRMLEKALQSEADAFFLDLEDATAPDKKAAARAAVVEVLDRPDWHDRERVVRINAIGSVWCLRDLLAVVGEAATPPDRLVVPKVQSAGDIAFVDRVIDQLLRERGTPDLSIALEVQIEDAHGLGNLDTILLESRRIAIVTFGQGDFAASIGMPADEIGVADEWDAAVQGDRWLLPRQSIVFAGARYRLPALN
ncbi:MAG: aldolase/citrate lyase family protein, partial [Chloroflexota bacterium]|nr:aldolase/citrate lyase family protein [Chloroflexota bacterium]